MSSGGFVVGYQTYYSHRFLRLHKTKKHQSSQVKSLHWAWRFENQEATHDTHHASSTFDFDTYIIQFLAPAPILAQEANPNLLPRLFPPSCSHTTPRCHVYCNRELMTFSPKRPGTKLDTFFPFFQCYTLISCRLAAGFQFSPPIS